MKKIFALLFALVASFGLLTSCELNQKTPTEPVEPTEPTVEEISQDLKNAKNYVKNIYQATEGKVTANMDRAAKVPVGTSKSAKVDWAVEVTSGDANAVSVQKAEDGSKWVVNVKYDNTITAEVKFVLTATITLEDGESTTISFNYTIPVFEANTIAEMIKEADKEKIYFLEGVITAVNKTEGNTAFIITDATGSIFCYDGLEVKLGQKVQITGNYSAYNDAFHQLAKPALVKVLAENQDLATVCGTPLVTTAQAINEAAKAEGATAVSLTEAYGGKFLEVTGYVVNANGYANLAVAADVASCCNLYANANLNLKSFVGQKVVVKGFARGVSVGNGITIQVQSVELAEVEDMTTPPIVEENAIVVKTLKEALELVDGKKVIVTGRVKSIDSKWSIQYNYMSITITDGTADYYVYRMKNCVNINDLIEITGITSSSDGKKQLAAGSTSEIIGIYVDRTFLADIDVLDDGTHVIVRGFVKEINTEWSEQYGNISVTITDGISDLYVYRLKTNVKVGDELIIYGQVGSYNGDKQIAAGSYADILSK